MKSCPNCGSPVNLISRLKGLNHTTIECGNCKKKYKMKYSTLFNSINIILIFTVFSQIDSILSKTTFVIGLLRGLSILIVWTLMALFVLSYILEYTEID